MDCCIACGDELYLVYWFNSARHNNDNISGVRSYSYANWCSIVLAELYDVTLYVDRIVHVNNGA